MNCKYPVDLKAEVIELISNKTLTVAQASKKYSIPANTLYGWISKHRSNTASDALVDSPRAEASPSPVGLNGANTSGLSADLLRPKLPSNLNFQDTISLWGYGRTVGFDSPDFGLKCRQKGVKAEDIIEFGFWIERTDKHDAISSCLVSHFDLAASRTSCAKYKGELAMYEQRMQDKDATIADMTTELFLRKKILTILS